MAKTFDGLFQFLDRLEKRADLDQLVHALAECEIDWDVLQPHVRFSERGYTRNAIRTGRWYQALVLCWRNGQRSPIHDHTGSVCGLRVLRGVMTETKFAFAPNGHVKATGSCDFSPGAVLGSHDDDLHQVSNLQAGAADLITLHIYSPALQQMGTYSLTDRSRGVELMLMDFSDAAGI